MVKIGFKLASEIYPSLELVNYARQAEDAGFDFVMISDHYHPWTNQEGNTLCLDHIRRNFTCNKRNSHSH